MKKKIGIIDCLFDDWHTNHFIRGIKNNAQRIKDNYDVAYAWGDDNDSEGTSMKAWSEIFEAEELTSVEDLVDKSDYIVFFPPKLSDYSERHDRIEQLLVESSKPVYFDKSSFLSLSSGKKMFELAHQHDTPLFYSSPLRFAAELSNQPGEMINSEQLEYLEVDGCGTFQQNAIHHFELIVSKMGVGAKRIKSLSTTHSNLLIIDYGDGRLASFNQMDHLPFRVNMQLKNGEGVLITDYSDIYAQIIDSVVTFFKTKKSPIPIEETLEVMALIEAGEEAFKDFDAWITV